MDHVLSFFNCNQRAGCFTTKYCYLTLHSRLLAIHRIFSFFSLKAAHLYRRSCCRLGATPASPPASAGSLGVTPSVGSGQASFFFSKPKKGLQLELLCRLHFFRQLSLHLAFVFLCPYPPPQTPAGQASSNLKKNQAIQVTLMEGHARPSFLKKP